MTLQEAISAAEAMLPGEAAPEGATDPRWQAIIKVGDFVETEPEAVWAFTHRWGQSDDADLRMAVATCIRINEQYRVCFVWTENGPDAVEIVDYH